MEEITNSGEIYLQLDVARTSKGMEIFVKAHPEVEAFMAANSNGQLDPLDAFGRNWVSRADEPALRAYRMENILNGVGYNFGFLCGALNPKNVVNLSWLQFEGISRPEGLHFIILGPFGQDFVRTFPRIAGVAAREFFKNYVAPIKVSLRISAQEI